MTQVGSVDKVKDDGSRFLLPNSVYLCSDSLIESLNNRDLKHPVLNSDMWKLINCCETQAVSL